MTTRKTSLWTCVVILLLAGGILAFHLLADEGGLVTSRRSLKIEIGMTRRQVEEILGPPFQGDPKELSKWFDQAAEEWIGRERSNSAVWIGNQHQVVVRFDAEGNVKTVMRSGVLAERSFWGRVRMWLAGG